MTRPKPTPLQVADLLDGRTLYTLDHADGALVFEYLPSEAGSIAAAAIRVAEIVEAADRAGPEARTEGVEAILKSALVRYRKVSGA